MSIFPNRREPNLMIKVSNASNFGVSDESKAYRLYDPATKKIIVSRDVIFEEGAK